MSLPFGCALFRVKCHIVIIHENTPFLLIKERFIQLIALTMITVLMSRPGDDSNSVNSHFPQIISELTVVRESLFVRKLNKFQYKIKCMWTE